MSAVPIAVTAGDATNAVVGAEWVLDGSGSNDPSGGSITSYTWAIAAKPPGSSAALSQASSVSARFTPDVVGTYRFFLVVTATGNVSSETTQGAAPSSAFSNISVPTGSGFIIPAVGQRDWGDHLYNTLVTVDSHLMSSPAENQFIFNPAISATTGNIYKAWADLIAAFDAVGSSVSREVVLDSTGLATGTHLLIPDGTYDFTNAKLSDGGARNYDRYVQALPEIWTGNTTPVTFATNAVITNLSSMEGVTFIGKASGPSQLQWAPGKRWAFYIDSCYFIGGAVPIIEVSGTGTIAEGFATLSQALATGSNTEVFNVVAPASLQVAFKDSSVLGADTVIGDVGSSLILTIDSSCDIGTQINFLGTLDPIDLVSETQYIQVNTTLVNGGVDQSSLDKVLQGLDTALSTGTSTIEDVLGVGNVAGDIQALKINEVGAIPVTGNNNGNALTIGASDGAGTGNGGDLVLIGGAAPGAGTDGVVRASSAFVAGLGITSSKSVILTPLSTSPGNTYELWSSNGGGVFYDGSLYWTASSGDHYNLTHPSATATEFTCDAAVAVADLVYIDGAGVVQKAQANSLTTSRVIGVVLEKHGTTSCFVATSGTAYSNATGTPGARMWLSANIAGAVTATAPANIGNIVAPVGLYAGSGNITLQIWPEVEIT